MAKESSHKEILTKETIWYNIIFYGLLPLFAVANIQGAVTLIIAIFRIHNDKIEIFTDKLIGLEEAADSFCKNTRRAFR